MGSVYIGIGHNDNFMITQFFPKSQNQPTTQSSSDIPDFLVREDAVNVGFFYIQNFTRKAKWPETSCPGPA